MSDTTGTQGGTQPLETTGPHHDVDDLRIDPDAERSRAARTPDPIAAVKDPDNRAKLLLGIGLLTLLNFLLLLVVLASVMDRHDQVVVDGTPCIISERDGEGVLFCQR